ncbi:MAG: thiamine-phosphate kinase [Anaerolineae bacterium]
MQISELGEFPLIDRVAEIVAVERDDVLVGIGDDVAVLDHGGEELLLAKVDIQVEGVHFLPGTISAHDLGRKALAINLSDIAAAGGRPYHALVSLALPAETEVAWVEDLYRGLRHEAERYGLIVVGGNMARSPGAIVVDVFVLGRVRREHVLLRSGAQPGDRVLVTGTLGDSAAGLALLQDPGIGLEPAQREMLLARHFTPTPRLPESAIIARRGSATAMIDVSDGLSSDVGHICERSGVGVRLWAARLPISPAARQVAGAAGRAAWQMALEGGEDYELCFTAPPDAAGTLAAAVEAETGTTVSIVGEILVEPGRYLVREDGTEVSLRAGGWQHFGSDSPQ